MDKPSNVYPSPDDTPKQEPAVKEESSMKPKEKKKMPKILYAIPIGILFLITIGVLSYLYLDKKNDFKALQSEKQSLQGEKQSLETELEKYVNYEETIAEYEETIADNAKEIKKLKSDIKKLKSQKSTLTSEKDSLTAENTQLEQDKQTLETQITEYEQKQATIALYNDFLSYTIDVVQLHGGFVNLTEAEYQTARQKAQATGDNDLVSAVDSAWNDTDIDQVTRFVSVLDAVSDGVAANL